MAFSVVGIDRLAVSAKHPWYSHVGGGGGGGGAGGLGGLGGGGGDGYAVQPYVTGPLRDCTDVTPPQLPMNATKNVCGMDAALTPDSTTEPPMRQVR